MNGSSWQEKDITLPPRAILTIGSNPQIKVTAETSDNKPIIVEGCTVDSLDSGTQGTLQVQDGITTVILTGNITKLNCRENSLTGLDVRELSDLLSLDCYKNLLQSLDVQNLTQLNELNCGLNQLTNLDVKNLSKLQQLDCRLNKLGSLDLQNLNKLKKLDCNNNQLISLNVQNSSQLEHLDCSDNMLTSLDVKNLGMLQKLYCDHNKLTNLNLQQLTALKHLTCTMNNLDSEDFIKILNALPERYSADEASCVLFSECPDDGYDQNYRFTAPIPEALREAFLKAKQHKKWKISKLGDYYEEIEISLP